MGYSSSLMQMFLLTALDMPSLNLNHTSLLPTAFPMAWTTHFSPRRENVC